MDSLLNAVLRYQACDDITPAQSQWAEGGLSSSEALEWVTYEEDGRWHGYIWKVLGYWGEKHL